MFKDQLDKKELMAKIRLIHELQWVHPRSQPMPPQYKDHLTIKTTLVAAQRWSLYQGSIVLSFVSGTGTCTGSGTCRNMAARSLLSVDFEVFGTVQGEFVF